MADKPVNRNCTFFGGVQNARRGTNAVPWHTLAYTRQESAAGKNGLTLYDPRDFVNNAVIVEKQGIQRNTPATQFVDESRLETMEKYQRAKPAINKKKKSGPHKSWPDGSWRSRQCCQGSSRQQWSQKDRRVGKCPSTASASEKTS